MKVSVPAKDTRISIQATTPAAALQSGMGQRQPTPSLPLTFWVTPAPPGKHPLPD